MNNINIIEKMQETIDTVLKNIPNQENLKLKKQNRIGQIIEFPPIETIEKYDITEWLNFNKYNDTIQRFEHILNEKFPHCNISAFYKNIKELRLIPETDMSSKLGKIFNNGTTGVFFLNSNKIKLYGHNNECLDNQKLNEDTLTHELLHMSTRRSNEFITFSGFEQNFALTSIGTALNEGYTEFLNCKYFSNYSYSEAYEEERYLAEGIEMIVGREQMEKYYFASDLKRLIVSLSQYRSSNEVIELITKMDKMTKAKKTTTKDQLFNELKVNIANIYIDKQASELSENKITTQEYEKRTKLIAREYAQGNILSENCEVCENDDEIIVMDSEHNNVLGLPKRNKTDASTMKKNIEKMELEAMLQREQKVETRAEKPLKQV